PWQLSRQKVRFPGSGTWFGRLPAAQVMRLQTRVLQPSRSFCGPWIAPVEVEFQREQAERRPPGGRSLGRLVGARALARVSRDRAVGLPSPCLLSQLLAPARWIAVSLAPTAPTS